MPDYIKMKKIARVVILLLAVFVGFRLANTAKADSYVVTVTLDKPSHTVDFLFDVNLNQSTYAPEETMHVLASAYPGSCDNGFTQGGVVDLVGVINRQTKTIINKNTGSFGVFGEQTFTAETTPGSYFARFPTTATFHFVYNGLFYTGNLTYQIPYDVVAGGGGGGSGAGTSTVPVLDASWLPTLKQTLTVIATPVGSASYATFYVRNVGAATTTLTWTCRLKPGYTPPPGLAINLTGCTGGPLTGGSVPFP